MSTPSPSASPSPERREFMKKACCVAIGGVLGAVPSAIGLAVYIDPLRREAGDGFTVKVASLDAVPADGTPRKFSIFARRTDAWTKTPEAAVGAVYLRRLAPDKVEAFNVVCPHAGCFVDYIADKSIYLCPCHDSKFAPDGKIASANSPAARGLDTLECTVRDGTEVWVKFENFEGGIAAKIPLT